jgi:FixJ family two-component response regulator
VSSGAFAGTRWTSLGQKQRRPRRDVLFHAPDAEKCWCFEARSGLSYGKRIHCVLVDDDASVRKAPTRLVRSAGYVVQAFPSARDFLDSVHISDQSSSCLILDVRMPGLSGLDLQPELQAANAVLPIIFITGHGDIPMSVRAMKEGAVDFLLKPVKDDDLLSAVESALERADQQRAQSAEIHDVQRRIAKLTPREREVIALVVAGMLNKQIAYELGTVEKTVKVHRACVMEKMEVDSLAELVRIAERIGLRKTNP